MQYIVEPDTSNTTVFNIAFCSACIVYGYFVRLYGKSISRDVGNSDSSTPDIKPL